MERYLIREVNYKGHKIKLYQDPDPDNPRNWDNLGTMICFHKRYNLGDETSLTSDMFSSWNELEQYLIKEKHAEVIAPLYMYDHSVIRIKIGSFHGLLPQGHAEFDSGQIGFIYVDRETLQKEYDVKRITKKIKEKAIRVLEDEVDIYDKWGSGQVYSFITETEEGKHIDSLSGIYDDNEAIKEAEKSIDNYIENTVKKHAYKLKAQMKSKVELKYRKPLKI